MAGGTRAMAQSDGRRGTDADRRGWPAEVRVDRRPPGCPVERHAVMARALAALGGER